MKFHGFNSVSEMHDALVKEAFLGAVAGALGRGALGLGKTIVRNPLKSLGTAATVGFSAIDVGGAAAKGARQAAQSSARNAFMGGLSNVAGQTF